MTNNFRQFQRESGCTEAEIMQALAEIEEQQLRAESRTTDPVSLGNRLSVRQQFRDLVNDDSTSDEAIAEFVSGKTDSGSPMAAQAVARIRRVISDGTLLFTSYEPPETVHLLCLTFELLKDNFPTDTRVPRVIIATDALYHPHASVRLVKDNLYSILLSSNLIGDLFAISGIFTDLVNDRQQHGARSFIRPFVTGDLRSAYECSKHAIQLPYQLAATAMGEKFRFALQVGGSPEIAAWQRNIYLCMLAFLIGHELGHIQLGHCSSHERPSQPEAFLDFVLDPSSPLYSLGDVPRAMCNHYREYYAWQHSREFHADLVGATTAGNLAVDLFSHRDAGFIAASIVLGLIAFMDRISFVLHEHADPVILVSEEDYNRKPLVIDVKLPRATHPWGRTRHAFLGPNLLLFSGLTFAGNEWDSLRDAIQNAHYPFSRAAQGACSTILFVVQSGREISCMLSPKGLHVHLWERRPDGSCYVISESIEDPFAFFGRRQAT
jgi:hypothetical protein